MKKLTSRNKDRNLQRTSRAVASADEKRRCAYCGEQAPLVWVHGHGQCSNCGINVQECCQGEVCGVR